MGRGVRRPPRLGNVVAALADCEWVRDMRGILGRVCGDPTVALSRKRIAGRHTKKPGDAFGGCGSLAVDGVLPVYCLWYGAVIAAPAAAERRGDDEAIRKLEHTSNLNIITIYLCLFRRSRRLWCIASGRASSDACLCFRGSLHLCFCQWHFAIFDCSVRGSVGRQIV